MHDRQTAVPIEDVDPEQPWTQLKAENDLWYSRFLIYRDMGPVRTVLGACKIERERTRKEKPKGTPRNWREMAAVYRWGVRAKAWDEYRRTEVFNQGYAYDITRIKKLNLLAEALFSRITKGFLNAKEPKGVNNEHVDLYLRTLEALAQETGGRSKKGADVSVSVDNNVNLTAPRVVFVMPERGDPDGDIDQMVPGEGETNGVEPT